MASEKNMRMEESGNGQQEIQEKISRATNIVMSLTKEKGITDDPSLQRKPTFWKGNIDPFIMPSLNNHSEQEELRKNLS